MEKDRKIKVLSIIALLIAVAGLTIAFAAMSKTLTINGTATMDTAVWDIHFENLTSKETGTGKIIKAPILKENDTYIGDFEVTLSKPGDIVRFDFDIVNGGDIDATLSDYLYNGYSQFNLDESKMNEIFASILVDADWDGDGVTTNEERIATFEEKGFGFMLDCEEMELKAGSSTKGFFYVVFNQSATELPKGDVTLKLNLQMLFEQA